LEIDDLDGGAAVVSIAPPDQVTSAPPPTIGRLSDEVLGGRRRDTHVGTGNTMSDTSLAARDGATRTSLPPTARRRF
jgi:hypothetical protein